MAGSRLIASLLCLAVAATATAVDLPERPIPFERLRDAFEPIAVVVEGRDACIRIDALLAANRDQQRRGLMWVDSMPPNAGMVFDYVQPRQMSMWMKNTLIPLDIAFITAEGIVLNVARDTVPLSLDSIPAAGPARYVLELNGGAARRLGLAAGSRVWVFER